MYVVIDGYSAGYTLVIDAIAWLSIRGTLGPEPGRGLIGWLSRHVCSLELRVAAHDVSELGTYKEASGTRVARHRKTCSQLQI